MLTSCTKHLCDFNTSISSKKSVDRIYMIKEQAHGGTADKCSSVTTTDLWCLAEKIDSSLLG